MTYLENGKGKRIAGGTQDEMFRYVKHHVPDGIYCIVGNGIDLVVERKDGIVYPTGGRIGGGKMPTRSQGEAKVVFEATDDDSNNENASP